MKGKPVWEVTVSTQGEAADAVADLLERLFNLSSWSYTDEETQVTHVTVYGLKRTDWFPRGRAKIATGLHRIRECGVPAVPGRITAKQVYREDWAESWKRHFHPLEIGPELLIKPTWSKRKPRPGQAVVLLDPGLSFGTGHHATTSFCLRELVAARKPGQPQALLDIGTGSGILAIAAAKLGYAPVHAFDFDPEAIRTARANADLNGVAHLIRLQRRDLTRLPRQSATRYDLVCANLLADILVAEHRRIINRAQPHGRLLLAGILQRQFTSVAGAFQASGWRQLRAKVDQEWQSGTFVRGKSV